MYETIIKNGTVVDGTGREKYRADVAVSKDEIVAVGDLQDKRAKKIIDAEGKIVSPGFIDIANHSDAYVALLNNPTLDSLVAQGVTTAFIGMRGSSLAPIGSDYLSSSVKKWSFFKKGIVINPSKGADVLKSMRKWGDVSGVNINWLTYKEFLKQLEKTGVGVNIGTLVGHGTLRRSIVGDNHRELSNSEKEHIGKLIAEAHHDGAFGMSVGLSYAHAYYISLGEIIEFAKTARMYNGKCFIHIRNNRNDIVHAVNEAIQVAEEAQIGVEITHLKTHKQHEEGYYQALKLLEQAKEKGVEINFDFYPYTNSWSVLYSYLPKWAIRGSREELLGRLKDKQQYNRMIEDMKRMDAILPYMRIAYAPFNKLFVGRVIQEIATKRNISPEEAILETLIACKGHAVCFTENENEKMLERSVKNSLSLIATGGAGYSLNMKKGGQLVHPRCFGTFPRFIKKYVVEEKIISIEKAIQKITSLPARKMNLDDRGFVAEGMKADIVVFDPLSIRSAATYQNPYIYPQGIDTVLINGEQVVENGTPLNKKSGAVLRNKHAR